MQAWILDRPCLLGLFSPLLLLNFILAIISWITPRMAAIPTLHMCWPNQNQNQNQSRNQNQKQRRRAAPTGLRNLGNSCYLNSVLQCLTHTPPLANLCLSSLHSSKCTVLLTSGGNSNCPFCLLEKHIHRSLTIDAAVETPSRIHNSLSLFAKHFRSGRQEDAHELLRYVVEACNKVCVKAYNIHNGIKSSGKQGEEPHTVVKEIFGGVLQNQVKCLTCNGESNKRDAIMDLSLDICNCSSLKEAMCHFFQPEILDGSNKYRCEKCKKLSAARKQMLVYQAPNVLVVQLKRFENMYGGKITRHVQFDDRLELAGYMCKASQDPVPEYALYGVIVHVGFTQEGGHYYSYVKDSNGKWFCCNDALVSPADAPTLFAEKAYMLFYIRTNAKPKMAKDNQVVSRNGHGPNAKSSLSENQKNTWKDSVLPMDSDRNINRPPLKFSVSRTINGQVSKHEAMNGSKKTSSWPDQHKQQADQAAYPGSANGNGNCCTAENRGKVPNKCDQRFEQEMETNNHLMLPLIANSSSCMPSIQNMNEIASTRKALPDSEPSTVAMVKNVSEIHGMGKIALKGDNFSSEELRYYSSNGGCQSMPVCNQNGSERVSKMAHHWQSGSDVISRDMDSTPNKTDKTFRCFQVGDPDCNELKALSNRLPLSTSGCSSSSKGMETGNTLLIQNSVSVEKKTCGTKRSLSDTYTISVIGNEVLGRGLQTDASVLAGLCHCLEKEARELLQECGWTDTVRESMRAAKRSKCISGVDAKSSKDFFREEIIGKVHDEMTKCIPNEVEGHLRGLLQYFFTYKK